ncbi:MAG: FprA family A-type flavoprotein, partial [Paramuribaculum sp.]|nr:FprA family A-type flavoprotein [Paramuribaculum sp.]
RGDAGEVVLFDLVRGDMRAAISQAFRLSSMVLASVTYDGGIFPAMADFISHLATKTYRNRRVGFIENGSWAPVAGRVMAKQMDTMTAIEPVEPVVSIKSRMHSETIPVLEALAASIVAD